MVDERLPNVAVSGDVLGLLEPLHHLGDRDVLDVLVYPPQVPWGSRKRATRSPKAIEVGSVTSFEPCDNAESTVASMS